KIVSLAKRFEEIYTSPTEPPLRLPEGSPPLKLMQNIRDEAHRFAITYHRKLRDKKLTASGLDSIPDIGEKNRKALLRHFRSVDKIAAADIDELMKVEGIGEKTASDIISRIPADTGNFDFLKEIVCENTNMGKNDLNNYFSQENCDYLP
ncbi:MAG TPA: helix-hairpin-helix domain-containing protein, partial [Candidatus Woesebacteria bacterium]|nr:helix-hairpin-helix domain-containing protein [Candidatus Woesebacteria bacterium]